MASGKEIIFGNPDAMQFLPTEGRGGFKCSHNERFLDMSRVLNIRVGAFFGKGFGYTFSRVSSPEGEVSSDGWVVGWDPTGAFLYFCPSLQCCVGLFWRETFAATAIFVHAGRALDRR